MQQLLVKDHRGFFTKLFCLLGTTRETSEAATRACATHGLVDWRSPEALAVFIAQAIILKYDIAQMERTHASGRRWAHAMSIQTHTVDF